MADSRKLNENNNLRSLIDKVQTLDDAIGDLSFAVQRRADRLKTAHCPSDFKKEFGKREVQRGIDSLRKHLTEYEKWKKDSAQSTSHWSQRGIGK